jgi:hypothetical protein
MKPKTCWFKQIPLYAHKALGGISTFIFASVPFRKDEGSPTPKIAF